MKFPLKIIILGSCVSRDAVSLESEKRFQLLDYYARTSFATLTGASFIDESVLINIASSWQRRMVMYDMQKSWLNKIKEKAGVLDVLLIDLIDERFHLYKSKGSVGTYSTEYKMAQADKVDLISSDSDLKFDLWKKGISVFFEATNNLDITKKIFINKVYYARVKNSSTKDEDIGNFSQEKIDKANKKLDAMYNEIAKIAPQVKFVQYPEELLVSDVNHKWGVSPFHFEQKMQIYQNNKIISILKSQQSFVIKHPYFNPLKVRLPIDWKNNPYNNSQWMHHFISLRWLNGKMPLNDVKTILQDFYKFHCVHKKNNPWYNTIRGDHAASIRLSTIIELKEKFENIGDLPGVGVCKRIEKESVLLLQQSGMYRDGHNHGLMLDIALLDAVEKFPYLERFVNLKEVVRRGNRTVEQMWFKSGVTKEHSVSYQEHNLKYTLEYFNKLEKLCLDMVPYVSVVKLIEESRRFLGFSYKSNGCYFAIGDTLRKPNKKILGSAFALRNYDVIVSNVLHPYSRENGVYCENGFFFYRNKIGEDLVHFAATCGWNSPNHKQHDELSFCLDYNGVSIIDDPGYSGLRGKEVLKELKSEKSHSTILLNGLDWQNNEEGYGTSRIVSYSANEFGFEVEMEHKRIENVIVRRVIKLKSNVLEVKDKVTSKVLKLSEFSTSQRLVVNPFLNSFIDKEDNSVLLSNENGFNCRIVTQYDSEISKSLIPYVALEKNDFKKAEVLDFNSHILNDENNCFYRKFTVFFGEELC